MKALIIEDERRAANRLMKLIESYDASIEVIGRIDSVKNAIQWFNENAHPDLVFMDIQLADGICFDIFDECEIRVPVIFTTAYDNFAIKAFKVNSIDYLLKPVAFKEFKASMDKLNTLFGKGMVNRENAENVKVMINQQYKSRFVVKLGEHIHAIRVETISCFLSKDKMTYIYTCENKKYIIDYTLEQIEHLVSPDVFYRINRKCIINLESIGDILFYPNSRLKVILKDLDDSEELVVSREKVQDFKNWLDR